MPSHLRLVLLAGPTHPAIPGSVGHATTDWSQRLLQVLGVSSEAIVAAGITTLNSAVTDISAAVTIAVFAQPAESCEEGEWEVRPVPP